MNLNPSKYGKKEIIYLKKVLASECWSGTSGNWVNSVEKEFAKKVGVKYAVAMNSGTSTISSSLEAVGVKTGDEVISPALTVIMDSTATIMANGIMRYCDVDEKTFNISPEALKKCITKKTKAIICVALYGLPPDYDAIKKVAGDIPIIEDNAQALFNLYKNKRIGTIGDIASYSFENSKILSVGEGGMIVTDNEDYARTCRKIGGHGFKNLQADEGRVRLNQEIFQNPLYLRHDSLGFNYRMSEFSAAILMAQLERADELQYLRKESAKIFLEVINESGLFMPQYVGEGMEHAYYTLGCVYNGEEKIGVDWKTFRKKYVENGGDGIYSAWSVPYLEPMIAEGKYKYRYPEIYNDLEYPKGLCKTAEFLQGLIMQFKTNFRDLKLAKKKALILKNTIKELKNK